MSRQSTFNLAPQRGAQTTFLSSKADICIYCGGAGSGKTYSLLLEAARHCRMPGFTATLFRRTAPEIRQPGGLWQESERIFPLLGGVASKHNLRWDFPGGGSIQFGGIECDQDLWKWLGSQITLLCFDELVTFSEDAFWWLLSRNRSQCAVRPYVRCATNPDAGSWVRRLIDWWVGPDGLIVPERSGATRWFVRLDGELVWGDTREELVDQFGPDCGAKSLSIVSARLDDNAILTRRDPTYRATLRSLPIVERSRLLDANWDICHSAGLLFKPEWFEIIPAAPATSNRCRAWDLAATAPRPGADPDWTSCVLVSREYGKPFAVEDVRRIKGSALQVEQFIRNVASQDGPKVLQVFDVDPGSAGKITQSHLARMLEGHRLHWTRPTTSKTERAGPVSSQCEAGNVSLVRAEWNDWFLRELVAFPSPHVHDDSVDAFVGAMTTLMGSARILLA